MFMRALPYVSLALVLGGCASAGPAPDERGLAALRDARALDAPAGDVIAGWLVADAVHAKLAPLPAVALDVEQCQTREPYMVPLVFEGPPGAVLTFEAGKVMLWRFDPARSCAVASMAYELREEPGGDIWISTDAEPIEGQLDVAGIPGGYRVALGPSRVELFAADGTSVFEQEATTALADIVPSVTCQKHASAMLDTVPATASSPALLHFSAHVNGTAAGGDGCGEDDYGFSASHSIWIALKPGAAPRVVSEDTTGDLGMGEPQHQMQTFDLPTGALVYTYDLTGDRYFGGGGSWTWSYVSQDGAASVLASAP